MFELHGFVTLIFYGKNTISVFIRAFQFSQKYPEIRIINQVVNQSILLNLLNIIYSCHSSKIKAEF